MTLRSPTAGHIAVVQVRGGDQVQAGGLLYEVADLGGICMDADLSENEFLFLAEGQAVALPKGSDLVLQMHFHPTGKVEMEQSTIGLYFAERPPEMPKDD